MPILIDELEIEIAPAGTAPDAAEAYDGARGAEVTPLAADEYQTAALMDLIAERRARLWVD